MVSVYNFELRKKIFGRTTMEPLKYEILIYSDTDNHRQNV
jgi:hypothetical protein